MRFRTNHLLPSLCLASCALSLSQSTMGQEPGLIEYAVTPRWGDVQTVSGRAEGGNAPLSASLFARTASQPPTVPKPPATGGPIQLPSRESSRADSTGPASKDAAAQDQDAKKVDSQDKEGTDQDSATKRSDNALTPLQNRKLSLPVQVVDLSVDGLGTGSLPESAAEKQEKLAFAGRGATFKCVHWHPSSICHYPLRFEDPMLERHGHVRFGCWQPLASGARFFATIPLLPYLHTLQPTCEPVYALGNYRPGSCAPLLRTTVPYDQQAAVVEALSLAGFFWAMPL